LARGTRCGFEVKLDSPFRPVNRVEDRTQGRLLGRGERAENRLGRRDFAGRSHKPRLGGENRNGQPGPDWSLDAGEGACVGIDAAGGAVERSGEVVFGQAPPT
jgi:hypothetical protein